MLVTAFVTIFVTIDLRRLFTLRDPGTSRTDYQMLGTSSIRAYDAGSESGDSAIRGCTYDRRCGTIGEEWRCDAVVDVAVFGHGITCDDQDRP